MTQNHTREPLFENQGPRAPRSTHNCLLLGSLLQELDIRQLFPAAASQSYRSAYEHLQTKSMSFEPCGAGSHPFLGGKQF